MMKYLFLILTYFMAMQSLKAEVVLEPLAGYNFQSNLKIDGQDNYSGTGFAYGGRAGYQKLGFQIGLDYLHSNVNLDYHEFGKDLSANEFAGFVGFEFPILIRIYAGYIFAAYAETTYDDKTGRGKKDLELDGGSGTKLGIGFTGLPYMAINLEYRNVQFGEYDLGNNTVDENVTYSAYLLTVSIPFVF